MKKLLVFLVLTMSPLHGEKFRWDNTNPSGTVQSYVFQFLQPDAQGQLVWVTASVITDDPATPDTNPPTEVTLPIPAGATKARVAAVGTNNLQSDYSNELGVIKVIGPTNLRILIELNLQTP